MLKQAHHSKMTKALSTPSIPTATKAEKFRGKSSSLITTISNQSDKAEKFRGKSSTLNSTISNQSDHVISMDGGCELEAQYGHVLS